MLTPHARENLRPEFCQLVGKSAAAVAELDTAAELRTALTDLELADELKNQTIEALMRKSDLELGIEALLGQKAQSQH